MIRMYDKPKKVKLVDLFSKSGEKYYIQTFEYGDFDNWVTAVIYEKNIVVGDYSFNSKNKKDGKYKIYFKTMYVPIDEAKVLVGGLHNSKRSFLGCGDDRHIGSLAELETLEILVDGEWVRE